MSDVNLTVDDRPWRFLILGGFEGENEKFTELLWAWHHGLLFRKIQLNFINVFTFSSWKSWMLRDLRTSTATLLQTGIAHDPSIIEMTQ